MHEIALEANKVLESIISRLANERGIDENLKARDMLSWVAEMNNYMSLAEAAIFEMLSNSECRLQLKH